MIYEDIYIRSRGEKIALSVFYKNEEFKNSKKEKPCIVFLPGTMANPFTYWDFLEEMVKYDICIVGLNYVGHGKSSRNKRDYTVSDLKQNSVDAIKYVEDNLERFGKSISVFGHSQGGIIASLLIGEDLNVNTYILGNMVVSKQKSIKRILGLDNLPNIFLPFFKFLVRIYGKMFKTKTMGFYDYVKIEEKPEEKEESKKEKDPLKIDRYPISMVTSLININTRNLTNPKKEIKEKIVVIVAKDDPIFPLEIEEEAFSMLNANNKKLIKFNSDKHMIYTEYPKETAEIIYNNL